jgi:hypothetical protein
MVPSAQPGIVLGRGNKAHADGVVLDEADLLKTLRSSTMHDKNPLFQGWLVTPFLTWKYWAYFI